MANSSTKLDSHLELTETHRTACSLAHGLYESLSHVPPIDPITIRRRASIIGNALQRTAKAERDCGWHSGNRHILTKPCAEMLEHHRLAFLGFERLCRELENNPSPRCEDIAGFAGEIERHMRAAEASHQASITTGHSSAA